MASITANPSLTIINEIDRTVHEPARLMILAVLQAVHSADFTFLLAQTRLTRGNLSSHLSKLEKAGYVEIQKGFIDRIPHTQLSLTPEGREAYHRYRRQLRQVVALLGE